MKNVAWKYSGEITQTPIAGRVASLDYLRVLSALAVVLIHVSDTYVFPFRFGHDSNLKFLVWLCLKQIGWFAVPVFFCLSGILFIGKKELQIKTLWRKYILRLFLIYVVWFIVSRSAQLYSKNTPLSSLIGDPLSFFRSGQPSHLWFLPQLILAYMLLPVLRQIASNWKVLEYFSIMFIAMSAITSLVKLLSDTFGIKTVDTLASAFPLASFTLNSCGILLFGYYIWHKEFSKRMRRWIYVFGVLGFVLLVSITYYSAIKYEALDRWAEGFTRIFAISAVVALITFFKHKFASTETGKIGTFLSSCTLGVYVIHGVIGMLILSTVKKFLPSWLFIGKMTIITIPLSALFVILVSLIITLILQKIPLIKKVV
jgi:surface polysaccharide O-acyltransferase-like enzyme